MITSPRHLDDVLQVFMSIDVTAADVQTGVGNFGHLLSTYKNILRDEMMIFYQL